jgi:hypothetical protein
LDRSGAERRRRAAGQVRHDRRTPPRHRPRPAAASGALGARIAPPPPDLATRPGQVSLWPAASLVLLVFLVLATIFAALF